VPAGGRRLRGAAADEEFAGFPIKLQDSLGLGGRAGNRNLSHAAMGREPAANLPGRRYQALGGNALAKAGTARRWHKGGNT
jgi:hypothetical protein